VASPKATGAARSIPPNNAAVLIMVSLSPVVSVYVREHRTLVCNLAWFLTANTPYLRICAKKLYIFWANL